MPVCNQCGMLRKVYADDEGNFYCDPCWKYYSKSPTPYQGFNCDTCQRSFANRSGLDNHHCEEYYKKFPKKTMPVCQQCGTQRKCEADDDGKFYCAHCWKEYESKFESTTNREITKKKSSDCGRGVTNHKDDSKMMCCYYLQGTCTHSASVCKFSHNDQGQSCHYGPTCRLNHNARSLQSSAPKKASNYVREFLRDALPPTKANRSLALEHAAKSLKLHSASSLDEIVETITTKHDQKAQKQVLSPLIQIFAPLWPGSDRESDNTEIAEQHLWAQHNSTPHATRALFLLLMQKKETSFLPPLDVITGSHDGVLDYVCSFIVKGAPAKTSYISENIAESFLRVYSLLKRSSACFERITIEELPEAASEMKITWTNFFEQMTKSRSLAVHGLRCEIASEFLTGCHPRKVEIGASVRIGEQLNRVAVYGLHGEIGPLFLASCTSLTHLQLDLTRVTKIGDNFLKNIFLESVSLYGLSGEIGSFFLASCTRLVHLQLDLTRVTKIGDDFLKNTYLETIVLNGLNGEIGSGFLSCEPTSTYLYRDQERTPHLSLTVGKVDDTVDLSHVTKIGAHFLGSRPVPNLMICGLNGEIGSHFLASCTALTHLQLDLSRVTKIGDHFLKNTSYLESVALYGLRGEIGSGFLSCDPAVPHYDTGPLRPGGRHFLVDHHHEAPQHMSLTVGDVPDTVDLSHVTKIGDNFLASRSVPKLTICGLNGEIGTSFLASCSALRHLQLDLTRVTKIGDHFLGNTFLESVTLHGINGEIGSYFLSWDPKLLEGQKKAPLSLTVGNVSDSVDLSHVTKIGDNFLANRAVPKLTICGLNGEIGTSFLGSC